MTTPGIGSANIGAAKWIRAPGLVVEDQAVSLPRQASIERARLRAFATIVATLPLPRTIEWLDRIAFVLCQVFTGIVRATAGCHSASQSEWIGIAHRPFHP